MGYVNKNLMPGEVVLARAYLHWIIFIKSLLFSIFALTLLLYALQCRYSNKPEEANLSLYAGIGLLLPCAWHALVAFVNRQSTELAVTSKRIIAKFGFIRRYTFELNHGKVESIHVEQGVIDRILGVGTLHINGTGGGITPIPKISDPLGFRRKAMEAIDETSFMRKI